MFDFIKAVILGVVEGITEFLPISSTGHLIIANQWLSFDESFTKMFDVVIQLGAILSVLIYFRHRLWPFGKGNDKKQVFDLWKKMIVGVLPALVIGFFMGDIIEEKLFKPVVVAIALFVGGVLLIILEKRKITNYKYNFLTDFGYTTVFAIGLFQCVAMIPGVSRSAATIIGAMILGASRVVAAEFSFFLAIPTMVAASGYSLLKSGLDMNAHEMAVLLTGFITSFAVAFGVIAVFMKYIRTKNFIPFGYYRIILGLVVLWYFLFK